MLLRFYCSFLFKRRLSLSLSLIFSKSRHLRDFDFRFIEFYSIFGKKCFCGKNQYEIHVRLDWFDLILGSGRRLVFRARPL